jgi:ADP-heptose:LPS heptosyltransferase/SAM-dependent methyltransferase
VTSGIAILKPDHLGDLVLSVPAIRAIRARQENTTLFVASRSRALARFLFPDIQDIRDADLRHLSRHAEEGRSSANLAGELNQFDHVICLRDDPIIRDIASRLTVPYTIASGGHLIHETSIQKQAVEWMTGRYSRTRLFSGISHAWPTNPKHIALCIAAGFPTNRWANALWTELAAEMGRQDMKVTLLGGPLERDDLQMLSRLLRRTRHDILIGGDDFADFLEALEPVDLVVATDGGTAHICSLRKPVCSIFGSSPWRRYAPFGQNNVVITRDEPCSPCVQFSSKELNGCVTRECMARISSDSVRRVIFSNGLDFSSVRRVWAERGISHKYEVTSNISPPATDLIAGMALNKQDQDQKGHGSRASHDVHLTGRASAEVDITDPRAMRDFMTRSGELGGPDALETIAWWRELRFTMPDALRRKTLELHPLSSDYADLQDLIYGHITGKSYNDLESERTYYDKDVMVSGLLAYPGRTPRDLNRYFHAMAKLMDEFHLDGPSAILDLGSGWGFTSEYMARLGHRVTGVDINPDFVETGTLRSARNQLGISYRTGTFGDLPLAEDERFDIIMSFESFHHCRDPLAALREMVPRLREGGQIILAGEPFIPASMWPTWGLRLDALSVWCIAESGWWETGWTREYMGFLFRGVGLRASFVDHKADMERYFIGKPGSVFQAAQLAYDPERLGWGRDRHYLISNGRSSLEFLRPLRAVILVIDNFSPGDLSLLISSPAMNGAMSVALRSGANRVEVLFDATPETPIWSLYLSCETWSPHAALGNGEISKIAFHLSEIEEIV